MGDTRRETPDRRQLLLLHQRALGVFELAELARDRVGVAARALALDCESPDREAERAEESSRGRPRRAPGRGGDSSGDPISTKSP